jgi:hypothetical protein
MNINYVVRHDTSIDNIFMWTYKVRYAIQIRTFVVEYLCVLLVESGAKHLPGLLICKAYICEGVWEKSREVKSTEAYIADDEAYRRIITGFHTY